MAHRIDLLGAPGCGKSTLYRALTSQRPRGASWLTEEPAVAAAARRIGRTAGHRLHWRRSAIAALLALPITRTHTARTIVAARADAGFQRFAREHASFLAAAADGFASSTKDEYRRAEGYRWYLEAVRRWATVDEWLPGVTVVTDESLSQKVFGVLPTENVDESLIQTYGRTMPAPRAVIHLDRPTDELVARIRHRERVAGVVIPGHRGLSDDQLAERVQVARAVADTLAGSLESRGVSTLRLQTPADHHAGAERALEVIDGLTTAQ